MGRAKRAVSRSRLVWTAVVLVLLAAGAGGGLGWWLMKMPGTSYRGPPPTLDDRQRASADRLRGHVQFLADTIGERNLFHPGTLDRAASYIEERLREHGADVERQWTTVRGERCANVIGSFPGRTAAVGTVVVGAHYDSVFGSPGANDNASAVAGLLELSRLVAAPRAQTVRFVAFANEEPPFFMTRNMGSYVYAKACRDAGDRIEAMICLEMLGCYSDEPKSQRYPPPLGFFYPSTGNFIGFVSNLKSRGLTKRVIGMFRDQARIPSEGICLPAIVPGIDWSDHRSFWRFGYPAVMVTDTAFYRYRYYHSPFDTPEKIDYQRMSEVVRALALVIEQLANDAP